MTIPLPNSGSTSWYSWAQQTDQWARNPQTNPLYELRPPGDKLLLARGEAVSVTAATEQNLLSVNGPGNVESIWMATPGPQPSLDARLRIYYDGSSTPAVDIDIGTLLAAHYGSSGPWHITPHVQFHIHGPSFNTGWMIYYSVPFGTSIRISYLASATTATVYWMVAYSLYSTDRANGLRLRSYGLRYPNAATVTAAQSYNLVPVGTITGGPGALLWHSYVGGWDSATTTDLTWLERNFSITIDGEASPSIVATGTEDWFDSAWYYNGVSDFLCGFYSYVATDTPAAPNQFAVGQATDFLGKWGGIPWSNSMSMTLDTEAACVTAHKFCYCLLYYQ